MHEIVLIKCDGCGDSLEPGSRFCGSCGTGAVDGAEPMSAPDQTFVIGQGQGKPGSPVHQSDTRTAPLTLPRTRAPQPARAGQNGAVNPSPVGEKIQETANQAVLKVKSAWGVRSMQAPIVALACLMFSLLLPAWVTIDSMAGDVSWAPSSLAGLGVAVPLTFGLAVFGGLVAHATGTRYGRWPLIAAATASFIAAVLSTSVVAFLTVVSALVGEITFIGGDLTIGLGPYLAMLSSATLLVLLLRLRAEGAEEAA